jgi:formate dehydrogenase iron-sulfur subunit
MRGEERERSLSTLADLCETMQHGSLCGLGGMTPFPVRSAMQHFPEDFTASRAN